MASIGFFYDPATGTYTPGCCEVNEDYTPRPLAKVVQHRAPVFSFKVVRGQLKAFRTKRTKPKR